MPDPEALALAWLRARPELAAITFGTMRPANLAERLPFVLVERSGGAAALPSWRPCALLDRAGLVLQAWAAPDRAAARSLILTVLGALYAARGVALPAGVIVRVNPLTGPAVLPDEQVPENVHRLTATVQAVTR